LQWACEYHREQINEIEKDNESRLHEVRQGRDEAIRAMVYKIQDERNRLLADIEELLATTSDQALNLKLGHVHVNAQDPLRFEAVPLSRRRTTSRPAITDSARVTPTARVSQFRQQPLATPELRHLAEKNKEMLIEIADLKTEIAKAMANRTDAIQTSKKLQIQIKREKEHFDAALQKLESQIFAEQSATKIIEKENSQIADAIEHFETLLRNNRKHIEHSRVRTMPLPIE